MFPAMGQVEKSTSYFQYCSTCLYIFERLPFLLNVLMCECCISNNAIVLIEFY